MPTRTHVIAILVIIGAPLTFFLFDSRYNTITYTCDTPRTFKLGPNFPGDIHGADLYLKGSVTSGSVAIAGMPSNRSGGSGTPQVFTAGSSAMESYEGEMYGPIEVTFAPASDTACELRLTYRLQSTLSMMNPLW
jgi:hypothetical protein